MKTMPRLRRSAALPAIALMISPLVAQQGPAGREAGPRDRPEGGPPPVELRMRGMLGVPGPADGGADLDPMHRQVQQQFQRWTEETLRDMPPEQRDRMRMRMQRMMEERLGTPEEPDAGRPEPGWRIGLGAVPVEPVLRTHLDLPKDSGLVVTDVLPDSPAAKAGIRRDDVLVSAGDRKLAGIDDLRVAVQDAGKAGRPVALTVIHEGKRRQVTMEPQGPPVEKPADRKAGPPTDRPLAAPRMMEEMNRRFQAMERRLEEMSQRLERQQRMIEELRQATGRVPEVRDRRPAPKERPKAREDAPEREPQRRERPQRPAAPEGTRPVD